MRCLWSIYVGHMQFKFVGHVHLHSPQYNHQRLLVHFILHVHTVQEQAYMDHASPGLMLLISYNIELGIVEP